MFRTRIVYHPRPTISFTLLFSLLQRIKRNLVGEEGVGVVKDKDPTLEEIESSHTLGGVVIHTYIRQSRGLRQTMPGWVAITDAPPV